MQIEDYQQVKVGDYVIGGTIGKGAYGVVKKGISLITNEVVAIKIISKPTVVDVAMEVDAMLQVNGHEHVVTLLNVYENNLGYYIVMEYCDFDLASTLCSGMPYAEDMARYVMWQLLKAVSHCHAKGIAHRDLKPENILIDNHHNDLR